MGIIQISSTAPYWRITPLGDNNKKETRHRVRRSAKAPAFVGPIMAGYSLQNRFGSGTASPERRYEQPLPRLLAFFRYHQRHRIGALRR